ncbi:alpha/beta hydrolase [Pusillimonas sp.]|uniref:alpha/beta hydrolase n=1 Tax=Pusillimonas sp. TaxID=3040095 RepID=UPI0037C9DC6F
MSYKPLPTRPAMLHPRAQEYADSILEWSTEALASTRHVLDMPYGEDDWHTLDLYLPDGDALRKRPVFMFLHGGAWTSGHKEWMGFLAPHFTRIGAIFISVSYRLAPEAKFPNQLLDTFDAIAWVWNHIHEYGGDPAALSIGGHSAGGHLATLAALSPEELERRGLPMDAIKACLPLSTPFDLRSPEGQRDPGQERVYRDLLDKADDDSAASPILHVRPTAVRFLVAYGDRDFPRIIEQSQAMAMKLLEVSCADVHLLRLADSDHFDTNMNGLSAEDPWIRAATALVGSTKIT